MFADDILRTVDWLNRTYAISALVLTGAGKAFSAGGNVKHTRDRAGSFGGDVAQVQKHYREGIQRIALAMHRLEIPSIAAVNGAAIGAGFDLATMCDVRLVSQTAVMGSTFVNLGIVPGDGGAWFLQRLVGPQRAAEMIFSGRIIGADEALSLGIVLEVTLPDDLSKRAMDLARTFAAKPPQALRLSKRLLKAATRVELPDFLDLCAVFQGMCHNSSDHTEAVNAFLEKTNAGLSVSRARRSWKPECFVNAKVCVLPTIKCWHTCSHVGMGGNVITVRSFARDVEATVVAIRCFSSDPVVLLDGGFSCRFQNLKFFAFPVKKRAELISFCCAFQ